MSDQEKVNKIYNEMLNNIKYAKSLEYIKIVPIFDKYK